MNLEYKTIKENFEIVQEKVLQAAQSVERNPNDIKIVVVTKKQPVETIQCVIEAGASILGENYPEEASKKISMIGNDHVIQWHMIGHLQSRKAGIITNHFKMMHSLDSLKLAEKLNRLCSEQNRRLPVCLEINVSGEESKGGWDVWEENRWDEMNPVIEACLGYEMLEIKGFMVMPPWSEDPEKTRPFFVKTRRFRDYFAKKHPQIAFTELSMGTSIDYPIAVQEGATFIRVGEAILGKRNTAV